MRTNQKYIGGKEYDIPTPLDEMPIFYKAGAIIPKYPTQQYVGEKVTDTVTLGIYFKEGQEVSYFYDDDKNGFGYEQGEYHYSKFSFSGSLQQIEITQTIEGSFEGELKQYILNFIGLPSTVKQCIVDGQQAELGQAINVDFKSIAITLE